MKLSPRDVLKLAQVSIIGASAILQPGCGGGQTIPAKNPRLGSYRASMKRVRNQFLIGKTEVTVGMWREYCADKGIDMPPSPWWDWVDSQPMVNITLDDCLAYASWAGMRLPTRDEWQLAASGGDGRNFPWGGYGPPPNPESPDIPGWDYDKCTHTAWGGKPVGSCTSGASPFGCLDMAGSVWEWTSTKSDEEHIVCGGSWDGWLPEAYMCTSTYHYTHDTYQDDIGFRLVLDMH